MDDKLKAELLDQVQVVSTVIVSATVCAPRDLPPNEVEEWYKGQWSDGSIWHLSTAETFEDGSPNPCPCEDENRIHYLVVR